MECNNTEVSICITDNKELYRLNKKYLSKAKATDVLSFPLGIPAKYWQLGDVVISLEKAEMQAKEFEVSVREEFLRLLVHGLLHLNGYEHEDVSKKVAAKMFRKQEQLLKRFT